MKEDYSWKSPADNVSNVIKNQTAVILASKRYRNSIKSAKAYPGAAAKTDHNPVIAQFEVR